MKKPVKLLTALSVVTAMTALTAKAAETEVPLMFGFMLTSDEWRDVEPAEEKYGIYSFRADGSTSFTAVSKLGPSNDWALDAGVLAGDTYYCYGVPEDGSWMKYNLNFKAVKSDEWIITRTNSFQYKNSDPDKVNSDAYLVPSDMAYDPINDVIYAAARRYQSQESSTLCTVDRTTGKLTRLGSIPSMCGLTSDATGKLYGIGTDGALYSVSYNGSTVSSNQIAHTGYYPSDMKQSAACDFKTGKIYWSAMCFGSIRDRNYNENVINALIEIDPATAESKISWTYPRDQRFSTLTIKNPHPLAPEDITDLTFEPAKFEALEAKVKFTVPSKTSASTITGSVTLRFYIDTKLVKTATATAGSKYEVTLSDLTDGEHILGVEVEYNGHTGNRIYATNYFGPDLPARISKVTLARDENDFTKATVSWEAPAVGVHGAAYDPSKIRYRVVRYPDEVVVKRSMTQTSFVDNVTSTYSRIFYAVTPYNVDRPSDLGSTTSSNSLMVGSDIVPPYKETFDSKNAFRTFTVIDVDENGDPEVWGTPTWMYDDQYYCAFYYGKRDIPADDWLVTPPFKFGKDRLYRLSYKYYGYYGYGNHFQVALGKEATDESLNRVIQDVERVTYSTDNPGIPTSVLFAPREGERFIGFHHISTTMEHLSIDDIEIEDCGDARIPDYVASIVAQRINENTSLLTFKAPELNAAGAKLEGTVTIKIFRNIATKPVAELSGVKPGESVSWTDKEAVKGKNDYTIYAVNSYGDGLPSYTSVDLADTPPLPVTEALTRYINDRQIEITWKPDETGVGENGNPIDLSEVRYVVYKPIYHEDSETEFLMIGRDLKTTRLIDDDPFAGLTDEQQVVNYYVAAVNGTDESIATLTSGVIIGPAYRLPFAESWREQTQETNPWNKIINNGAGWYIRHQGYDPMGGYQDAGYGVLTCEIDDQDQGTGGIMTPRIDLTSLTDPELSFYYYRGPEYDDDVRLLVAITAEGTTQIKYLPTTYQPKSATAGWEKVTVSLSDYSHLERASIILVAYVKKDQHIHVDNFRIDGKQNPGIVRPKFITGESQCRENAPYRFVGAVCNFGTSAVSNVKATLKAGNEVIGTATIPSIQPNETAETSFEFTPGEKHVGTTVLTLLVGNDTEGATKEIEVSPFNPATITDLTGDSRTADKVTLYWSVPTRPAVAQRVNETFDSYDAFAIDSIGGWTLIDMDGFVPFKFSNGQGGTLEWPNNTKPQSFMVFNPLMVRNAPSAYNGLNYMVCWGSPMGQNNDWLVSPELTGEKQYISFYARSFMGGREEFHFLVSNTDCEPSSFVSLTGSEPKTAPSGWGYYQFVIPAGTRYFAINYVGNRQEGLMLDDFVFEGFHNPILPDGYNVYRDGRKLNSKPLTERNFVDTDVDTDTQHTYIVRALYNGVESDDSNPVTLAASSIDGIGSAEDSVSVEGRVSSIHIEGAAGLRIEIYRPDGALINALVGVDNLDIDATAGIYIVKVGKEAVKVVVR